ncbi:MAG: hypothetical protein DWQ37_13345 [Planctomycetota bacterium]|nr:MAG: hypothetical protein DWQ37_13345 [Planctomycetota bacterium]
MSRKTRNIGAGTLGVGLAVLAVLVPLTALQGDDVGGSDLGKTSLQTGQPQGKLVVHEWGTFTSFTGSDGVNLEFRPLVTNDLPKFIHSPAVLLGKGRIGAQQRMETPVTYFYTDRPRSVNVRVDFPRGMLTEWFPPVRGFDTGAAHKERSMGNAYLDWKTVKLIPPEQFADVRVRNKDGQPVPATLPDVGENEHYGQARATDSAIVEVYDGDRYSFFEKFLFYRGLGNFELPLEMVARGQDRFTITNSSHEASGALILVSIDNDRVRFVEHAPVDPQSSIEIELPKSTSSVEALAAATVEALTATGLYQKEAQAMVNTWRTSWFEESGTRLFYLVPEKLTDELLPLTVEPKPDEQVRVLVGRLETLTPEDCVRLVEELAGEQASAESVATELARLGRFAAPEIEFVMAQTKEASAQARLKEILAEIREKRDRSVSAFLGAPASR